MPSRPDYSARSSFLRVKLNVSANSVSIVLNSHCPAVQLDNMLDNGKAESRPPYFAASAGIDTIETLEEPWNACRRYSRA